MAARSAAGRRLARPDFMRTSMGLATAFLASNMVYGSNWDVDAAETLDADATAEKFPKGEYFIVDVQTHFTDGVAIGFRKAEFVRNMGLRAYFSRLTDERLREYDPTWSDEQLVQWDGNFRSDGALMLIRCERDIEIAEYRIVLQEHIRRRGL